MTTKQRVGIVGVGYAVPETVRRNDDPVFDTLRKQHTANADLFFGFEERRVLADNESLDPFMTAAARNALADAGIAADQVELLLGYASVGEYLSPNPLAVVHRDLGLPSSAWVLPIATEYTNFLDGLALARPMLESGRSKIALVVCGSDWSRRVEYHRAECIGAGDGAGAAVLALTSSDSAFAIVDEISLTTTEHYGAMTLECRETAPLGVAAPAARPIFHMHAAGRHSFLQWAHDMPCEVVSALLQRNGLSSADITLITHQASRALLDAWARTIQPACYLDTQTRFGNLTVASVAVTLAARHAEIQTRHVVLLGIGIQHHLRAVLLSR